MGSLIAYAQLGARERSLVDAFAKGEVWSPGYYATWIRAHRMVAQAAIRPIRQEDSGGDTQGPISAEFIREALYGRVQTEQGSALVVDDRGARMEGLSIEGALDLTALKFPRPLLFKFCHFASPVVLRDTKMGSVCLEGSTLPGFEATNAEFNGDLELQNIKNCRCVILRSVHINGLLDLHGARLNEKNDELLNDRALDCYGALIEGTTRIGNGFLAHGEVTFLGAEIGGAVNCWGGTFHAPPNAFDVPKKHAGRRVALNFDSAKIGGSVRMTDGFTAHGEVYFVRADIGGWLNCEGAVILNKGRYALNMDVSTIKSEVRLNNARCEGEVSFVRAKIGNEFNAEDAAFDDSAGIALNLRGIHIDGSLSLSRADIRGSCHLAGATIGDRLLCNRARFVRQSETGDAIPASGASVKNSAEFRDVTIEGGMSMKRACIGGNLDFKRASITRPGRRALKLGLIQVHRTLILTNLEKFEGQLDLRNAHAKVFADDGSYWRDPLSKKGKARPGSSLLDGFTYDAFADPDGGRRTSTDYRSRFAWIKSQPRELWAADFRPQPFTQCAKILRAMGHGSDADMILNRRERLRSKSRNASFGQRIAGFCLGKLAGHGYKTHYALHWAILVWLFGLCVFWITYKAGGMHVASDDIIASDSYQRTLVKPKDYEPFHAWVYSADLLVPIIDFGNAEYWVPRDGSEDGFHLRQGFAQIPHLAWVRRLTPHGLWSAAGWAAHQVPRWLIVWFPKAYYWFEIFMGWLLSTVAVAGLTGLLGREKGD